MNKSTISPGVYKINNDYYQKGPGISNSMLSVLRNKTPNDYYYRYVLANAGEETEALRFGNLQHMIIFEPEEFEKSVVVGPINDRRLKAWKEFEKDTEESKSLITPAEHKKLIDIRDAIMRSDAGRIVNPADGDAEMACYAIDDGTGLLKRCKYDFYNKRLGVVVDVKTTDNADPQKFVYSVRKYQYNIANAYYMDIFKELDCIDVDVFAFIAVEKTPPYNCSINTVQDEWVQKGREEYKKNLIELMACMEKNHWPAYEGIFELDEFGNAMRK